MTEMEAARAIRRRPVLPESTPFVSSSALEVWAEIRRLKLESHIAELETLGLTVIPPQMAAPPGFAAELHEAILATIERRGFARPDLSGEEEGQADAVGEMHWYMLLEDPAFRRALVNPVVLALVTYMLGENALLGNCSALLKRQGNRDLLLHCDTVRESAPFPPHVQSCNATYCLSDWSLEDGATCYAPGSHHYYRHPLPGEGDADRVAVEAAAGSIIFFNGNTWHGAFARRKPGIRMSLIMSFYRPHWRTQECYADRLTPELLREHPRLATLLGGKINWPFREEGPQGDDNAYLMGRHVFQ